MKGTVKEVDAKGAVIALADNVEGYLAAADIARERTEDASKVLNVGDEVEAKIVRADRKARNITLSIKAKDEADERQALKELSNATTENQPKTLGDIFADQLKG